VSLTDRQRELLAGRIVVVSVSGGKDSTAMALYLQRECGLEVRRVFADTGWEAPETYEYVREYLPTVLGPIDEVRWTPSEGHEPGMVGITKKKGMFPSRPRRYCTEELKVKPLAAYIKEQGEKTVNAIGIRAAESAARAKRPGCDCLVWCPLLRWTEAEVIATHTRHGVRPNPLYLAGASRVGCFPCIFSRKSELRWIGEKFPERIDLIRDLEAQVQERAAARYAEKGETFASLGYSPPTFFAMRSEGKGSMVSIDKVMLWARTAHGGKQFELFARDGEDGCVRWGLCEAGPDDDTEAA
jgi:3'-phosphoadenosine 5'-phosphosulfate sulfotransferase (PAPS reductase)/FAD synthetase